MVQVDGGATFQVKNGELVSRNNPGSSPQPDQLAQEQLEHLHPHDRTPDALWQLIQGLLGTKSSGTVGKVKRK